MKNKTAAKSATVANALHATENIRLVYFPMMLDVQPVSY
jgi:hypothetical protein